MLYKLYRLYTISIGYIMLYKGYWCLLMSFGFGAFPATVTPSLSRLVQRGIHHHSGHLSASTDIAMYCEVLLHLTALRLLPQSDSLPFSNLG